jgi:hypothetical protein
MRYRRGYKNSFDVFELWLRLLGEDGDMNRIIGRVELHEENVYDLCIGDGISK